MGFYRPYRNKEAFFLYLFVKFNAYFQIKIIPKFSNATGSYALISGRLDCWNISIERDSNCISANSTVER